MSKIYLIGEKNGVRFVGHMTNNEACARLDSHQMIGKAEYRRCRQDGIPSWGETQTEQARKASRNPSRAKRWEMRAAKARDEARKRDLAARRKQVSEMGI